jgi:hypothetical protein
MEEFAFLRDYIESLPIGKRHHSDYPFILKTGINEAKIRVFEVEFGIIVPRELRLFYVFSYGANLSDYKMLTIPQIIEQIGWLRSAGEFWKDSIFPFARVIDVGDVIAFDLDESNDIGLKILDGFHETPPVEWKGICFGLKTWLIKMVENDFHPFWLKE